MMNMTEEHLVPELQLGVGTFGTRSSGYVWEHLVPELQLGVGTFGTVPEAQVMCGNIWYQSSS